MPPEPKDYVKAYHRVLEENTKLKASEWRLSVENANMREELERLRGLDKVVEALKDVLIRREERKTT